MKLTQDKVESETMWMRRYIVNQQKRLDSCLKDLNREARLKLHECRKCYYLLGKIAGQAFTDYTCRNCGIELSHPNTNVPKYCDACAAEHHACIRCGASLEDEIDDRD